MANINGRIRGLWLNGNPAAGNGDVLYPETARENLRPLSKMQLEKMLGYEIEAENYEFCCIIRDVLSEKNTPDND